MAYQIKSSKFNAESITAGARPTRRVVQNGMPTKVNFESIAIDKVSTDLLEKDLMPNDLPPSSTEAEIATLCLAGLGITVEEVLESEPEKTFRRPKLKKQNSADERNGMKKQSTPEYTFTDSTDPFYEMDQSPAVYVQTQRTKSESSKDTRALTSIVAAIGDINQISNHLRLKQLVEK